LNIRKFVAPTNREALRKVREALGDDAVVLSNRVLEDGSVEITAMGASELATIARPTGAQQRPADTGGTREHATPAGARRGINPAAASASSDVEPSPFAPFHADDDGEEGVALSGSLGGLGASAKRAMNRLAGAIGANASRELPGASDQNAARGHASVPDLNAARAHSGAPDTNASRGLPDVYSSVFGASAEPHPAAEATPARNMPGQPDAARMQPLNAGTAPTTRVQRAANAVLDAARDELAAPGTLGEANQWLIEHALRVSQSGVQNSTTLTPSVAAAKGLGTPGELTPMSAPVPRAPVTRAAQRDVDRRPFSQPQPARTPSTQPAAHSAQASAQPVRAAAHTARPAAPSTQPEARAATQIELSEDIQLRIAELVKQKVSVELAAMRGMMEEQFATLVWSDRQRARPVQVELSKRLFSAGFSAQLVRMMLDHLPQNGGMDEAFDWVQSTLETNLPVLESEDALMDEGGVFALMGPTGVGKTTTTAKLAARCVMRFGASKVALLTTDSYRIGAHEQLRIYGKILGVSVHAVKDAADLQLALSELRNKHIVLIDTIGMSQRERHLSDQIAMLTGAGRPVKRLLLLSATSHGDTLNEVVQAYRAAPAGSPVPPLAGCILTKLDEATNLGAVLDTVIRYKLPVHYVSTGQKVPENLYVATRRFLIKSAFCIPRDSSPFVPQEEDLPVLLSALSLRSTAEQHEVHFG
jgi:flagellar biosynthesis protein FlhF